MNLLSPKARQPPRQLWSHERLVHERALALGSTLEVSTLSNYSSALNSYLTFTCLHDLPAKPTEDTLSFYVVFMCQQINSRSVATYLSGITQQLESFFPAARLIRHSKLVEKTLTSCQKRYAEPTCRKLPLALHDLQYVLDCYSSTPSAHDDLLFIALLLTGFSALLRLGELVFPDSTTLST